MQNNASIFLSFILLIYSVLVAIVVVAYLESGIFFYGDSYNFITYGEDITFGKDLVDPSTINVLFVSFLYSSNPLTNLTINIFIYIASLAMVLRKTNRLDLISIGIIFLVFTNCGMLTRLLEPSREYILYLSLFLAALYSKQKNRFPFIVLLLIVIAVRPVYSIALPFILLNTYYVLLCTTLISFIFTYFELNYFSFIFGRAGAYGGAYGDSVFASTILNFVGGINAWANNEFPLQDRIIFFISYIQRGVALIIIALSNRSSLFTLVLFSITLSVILGFPHPRYLEPLIFFFLGIALLERQRETLFQ